MYIPNVQSILAAGLALTGMPEMMKKRESSKCSVLPLDPTLDLRAAAQAGSLFGPLILASSTPHQLRLLASVAAPPGPMAVALQSMVGVAGTGVLSLPSQSYPSPIRTPLY